MTPLLYFSLILLTRVRAEEVSTPSSLLGPRNFNHHPFDAEKYLKSLNLPVPTKQGPVLFPNDAPPPPRPPLIVTSRPLIESIARSELNPLPANSSVAESRVAFIPYLARVKDYKPFGFSDGYKNEGDSGRYNYEVQTGLPPIYKAFSDHAQENVAKIQQKPVHYEYQVKEPEYTHRQTNDIHDDNNSVSDHNQNYEFSYVVKDKNTGDDFSHSQHSSGSATNGEYRVRLPDGRTQIVSYTADENGYKADVRYDDEDDKTTGNSINNDYGGNKNNNNYVNNDYGRNNNYHINNDYNNNDKNQIYKDYNTNIYSGYNDDRNAYKVINKISDDYENGRNNYISNNNVHNDYGVNHNDYTSKVGNNIQPTNYKVDTKEDAGKDDFYNNYSDSKEYYNDDYSSENNGNYQPYKSKFTNIVNNENLPENNYNNIQFVSSTVKPSYEQLKDLFASKKIYNTQQNYDKPFNYNAALSTSIPDYDVTTENVVLIGAKPNIYTNTRNIPVTISPSTYTSAAPFIATTPRSYLVSTIANLRHRINSNQPVLSDRFIDKINKYLNFK